MKNSICNFMPAKSSNSGIKTVNFVYESDFKSLNQPFIEPTFALHLVTKGEAVLKICENKYKLKVGDIFFSFAGVPYEIDGDSSFKYMYISFVGTYSTQLLNDLEINVNRPVYKDLEVSTEFWLNSIRRVNQFNSNIITESVLLYTLSFINNKSEDVKLKKNNENMFENIVDYINNHYYERDLNLKKIADIFSYTEKYLSYLFKKNMDVGFNRYLNNLRMQYACNLIDNNVENVSEIASMCGFSDSLYFSKVFKKREGISPTEYIKNKSTAK